MVDAYYQLLEQCCAKVSNGKQGTAFFISPRLAVTCAHVVPDGKTKGEWIEITPYVTGKAENVQILDISRNTYEDYCILLTQEFVADFFVILNLKNDVLGSGKKLLGYGFPALDTLQLEAFDGDYVGPIKPGKYKEYQYPSLKLKDGQIKPGFSGSPVIDTETGRCVGVVSKTFDRNSNLGGWVISADLYLSRLESDELKAHWPADIAQMEAKWRDANKRHLAHQPEIRVTSVIERFDKAYICDRTQFSKNYKAFDHYSLKQGLQVNHHLIAGKTIHSPTGLARKLLYENIVKKTNAPFYPSNPQEPEGRSIKLEVNISTTLVDFLADLRLLYVSDPAEKAILVNQNEKQLYNDLVRNFNANPYNLHIATVEFPAGRQQQAEIFEFLKQFTELLEEKTQMIRSKVFFFWCFIPARFSYNDNAPSIMQNVVTSKIPFQSARWRVLSIIPLINQLMLRSAIKKLAPADYFIWPVNQGDLLEKLPKKDILKWISDINGSKPTVDQDRIKKILRIKHTTDIENEFIKIIDEYNKL